MPESVVVQRLDEATQDGWEELERLLNEVASLAILLAIEPKQLQFELKKAIDHHYPL